MSVNRSIDDLFNDLPRLDEKEGAAIRVTSLVEARLTSGKGLGVTELGPAEQAISSTETTRWAWELTPVDGGTHTLHLVINVRFRLGSDTVQRCVRRFERTIHVNVTLAERTTAFVARHYEWILTFLVIPPLGLLYKVVRKRKSRPPMIKGFRP